MIRRASFVIVVAVVTLLGAGTRAPAFHRQTPPIVQLTSSGDNTAILPRVHPEFFAPLTLGIDTKTLDPGYFRKQLLPSGFGSGNGGHTSIVRQNWFDKKFQELANSGDPANPSASGSGLEVAWDAECTLLCNGHGRQIFVWQLNQIAQVTDDPTGTSTHPAFNGRGDLLAFESLGDLTGANPGGTSQIFLATVDDEPLGIPPTFTQVSHGSGTSQSAVIDFTGRDIVFQSTNDTAGHDTGISQIWLGVAGLPPEPITQGAGPSRSPDLSGDGRMVVFESTAALASDGHDTRVSQIFAYDPRRRVTTQLTNSPVGCTRPTVHAYKIDWRVAYVCHGTAFLSLVAKKEQFKLPIPSGADTVQVLDFENNFVVVSTTADLTGGKPAALAPAQGTTEGHQLYLVNLFKLPAVPLIAPLPPPLRR